MERLRVYAIIAIVGVLTGVGFLVGGCSGSTDPYDRASLVVVCNPGDRIILGLWEPNAQQGSAAIVRDTVTATNRYDALQTGTWKVAALLMKPEGEWRIRTLTLKAGQCDTFNIYVD